MARRKIRGKSSVSPASTPLFFNKTTRHFATRYVLGENGKYYQTRKPVRIFRKSLYNKIRDNANPPLLAKRLSRRYLIPAPVKAQAQKIENSLVNFAQNNDTLRKAICAKRKVRRAVLFAKGKFGGNHRSPSYSLESKIKC